MLAWRFRSCRQQYSMYMPWFCIIPCTYWTHGIVVIIRVCISRIMLLSLLVPWIVLLLLLLLLLKSSRVCHRCLKLTGLDRHAYRKSHNIFIQENEELTFECYVKHNVELFTLRFPKHILEIAGLIKDTKRWKQTSAVVLLACAVLAELWLLLMEARACLAFSHSGFSWTWPSPPTPYDLPRQRNETFVISVLFDFFIAQLAANKILRLKN